MSSETTEQFVDEYPWISKAFFERILRREHQDNTIVVKDFTLKPALGKGENYASQMLRVRVNFSSTKDPSVDQISLIVKAAVTKNIEIAAFTAELNVFRQEIIIFQQIIPEVEKLLHSIGEYSRLSAKCYDASVELSYLVFEDLSASGYANVNRRTGLDVEHFKLVLTKVSKWHAATAVLVSKNPSLVNDFQSNMFLTDGIKPMISNSTKALVDVVKEIPGLEHLSPKLQRLSTCVLQKVFIAAERDPNAFNVIIHGDLWCNNVMFSHDSVTDNPKDAILVDFQCCFFGSPVLDIVNTLFTSSSESLCAHDWDEIVIHYHKELLRLLKKFGYSKPLPTLAGLQADQIKRTHYSATLGMYALALRNLENVHDGELLSFIGQSEEDHKYRVQNMLNPKIRKALQFLLQYCDDNGLLD